jgi:hypothetical protein
MKRFRLTPQRLAIRKFLEGNFFHPSAEELLDIPEKWRPVKKGRRKLRRPKFSGHHQAGG